MSPVFSPFTACAVAALALSGVVTSAPFVEERAIGSASVSSTVLVIARDAASAAVGYSGLQGYGIPFQTLLVPSTGATLPQLNSSTTAGNFGGILVLSEVSYDYNEQFLSALTESQWQQLYDYQVAFGIRMVRVDAFPSADFGVIDVNGNGNDEPVSITNSSDFPTANIKTNAQVSIAGIWHYPATITNTSIAWEVAQFSTVGTAAVVNSIGGRQQQVWFLPFAQDWSPASNFLQHAWIHWMTRGLYVGFRRVYFNTQVDDMFLETDIYSPANTTFRIRPDDLSNHVTWQANLNTRLPSGSQYVIEIGHNGNGDIEAALDTAGSSTCKPDTAIEYADQIDTPLEFQKPLGTGTNIWPTTPTSYTWSLACAKLDALEQWFATASNLNAFSHISHTFTHESLDNATYSDALKEITFNIAWLKQVGIWNANRFSASGLIPPAITGLHNGDAIRAWMTNGVSNIKYVVGDNTRPVLLNTQNPFWPLITTLTANGYDGLVIVPRWATTIYYNCDLPACTLAEWINTSAGSGTFDNLLADAKATNTRHLLGLHWDPYMFHQANLRQTDVASTVVNGSSQQLSLLQIWVETVVAEMTRLVTWPFITLKHDDLALQFVNRQTRDNCNPNINYNLSKDGKSIISVTVTANDNTCATTIPVTFPGPVTSTSGATTEQVGTDPLTLWVTMSGSARTYTLTTAIQL
ncbi:uncharacterized protein BDZ99DRAFT_445777 [Mytilinidion resinicola]|uniref:Extracellular serine-rich protein n=1 Tax=Mytilinidion resinicola TaxID=574789 RepID=A0A6A6YIN0_9PEZI|nr:uncharacterized protein BDZ99DRAFT_445777 [Mytilinidion resinicola]KAF2808373.1 hypothetical protein BDZ99DRAFT_445777 [Mytilinidion resinicola]